MLIDVIVGGQTKFLPNGVPYVEGGEPSVMDTDELTLKTYPMAETKDARNLVAVEYWEGNQFRHRSINGELKPKELGQVQGHFV
jgi:hypothetical protein